MVEAPFHLLTFLDWLEVERSLQYVCVSAVKGWLTGEGKDREEEYEIEVTGCVVSTFLPALPGMDVSARRPRSH